MQYHLGMTSPTDLMAGLEASGDRLTGPRRALARLIGEREGAFTAADLLADVQQGGLRVGRATVFRAIERLEAIGLVERVDLPSGEHAYVACVPAHHHHVICARCGRAAEVGDLGLGTLAREVARRTGYRVDEHRLELFGLCPACQASP
jgi:Fur family ferric uptake transcriptional regulator